MRVKGVDLTRLLLMSPAIPLYLPFALSGAAGVGVLLCRVPLLLTAGSLPMEEETARSCLHPPRGVRVSVGLPVCKGPGVLAGRPGQPRRPLSGQPRRALGACSWCRQALGGAPGWLTATRHPLETALETTPIREGAPVALPWSRPPDHDLA